MDPITEKKMNYLFGTTDFERIIEDIKLANKSGRDWENSYFNKIYINKDFITDFHEKKIFTESAVFRIT